MKLKFRQPETTGPLVTLDHGDYRLVVAPQFGARIVSFTYKGRDVLRPATEASLAKPKVYEFAGFPLMPYSGPLFGPGFSFAGETYALDRTVREEPSATHGDAWIALFKIVSQSSDKLALRYDHEPEQGTFPFRFRGEIEYSVSAKGLALLLRVTSRDHRPVPAGIGFHPYFLKHKGTRLTFEAVGVWPADAPEAVTLPCGPLIEGLSFRDGPDVSEMVVDRLYEGWDGRAALTYADGFRVAITAHGVLDKLQLYSAWDYPYVCVEPVSNANDGYNRMAAGMPGHGIRVLDPGRSVEGTIRIFVEGR